MSDIEKSSSDERTGVSGSWDLWRRFTSARIGLSKTGSAILTRDYLDFKLAHAKARDAVFSSLNTLSLAEALTTIQDPVYNLHSKVKDRTEYLRRPDYGRVLDDYSRNVLEKISSQQSYDVAIILADGLSATAINLYGVELVKKLTTELLAMGLTLAPFTFAGQARVAIGDEIGFLLKSEIAVVLIGERPGLTSPNSLGVYLTYRPTPGMTDESRNCVSNIHPQGLSFQEATVKIVYLIRESLKRKLSGVQLKDNSGLLH